ncbi:hypothetical protein F1880_004050 [Penicillium rolfsii]|nr:hypothetical protein F1880_004050 [Penicillium rolfsii]
MGISGSRFADQASSLDDGYALVLDSQKHVHHYPGPEEHIDFESADNWLELQIFQWREHCPTLVLRMGPASSDVSFTDHLDQSTDTLQFVFRLPAEYPGGRVGLLHNIRKLLEDQHPFGIVETHFGPTETSRVLGSISWNRQHGKDQRWNNAPKAYNCKVGCAQSSSQLIFKFRVDTGESALLVVDKNADGFKSAVGQQRPLQQQLAFMQLITLPVRVWLCIQYRQCPRSGDASQRRAPQVNQRGAETIRNASSLATYAGSPTGSSGALKKLTDDTTQQAAHETASVKIDESAIEEQLDPDRQSSKQSVVLPGEGKREEKKETSKKPIDKSESMAESLPVEMARRWRNKPKRPSLRRRKALAKAAERVHADAQPQQQQSNDEHSALAARSVTGQAPVVRSLVLTEDELRSPTSATASFRTARSPCLSRISTSSGNFQTPPLSFAGESVEEGPQEMSSPQTVIGARGESDERRSAVAATSTTATTHPPEISPRSERGSPILASKVEPVLGQTAKRRQRQKLKSKMLKRGQDPVKLEEDEVDDTNAATAHIEALRREDSPQKVCGITVQPFPPRTEASSGPASRHQSPMKDQEREIAGKITTMAEALQSLDLDSASAASAGVPSNISGSVLPRSTSRQSLATSQESAEIRPSSSATVSAGHQKRNESSSAAKSTMTPGLPPKPRWTVDRPTRRSARRGAPPTFTYPAQTPGFNAAVPAIHYPSGGFVSGANPTMTPDPMMAMVPAGPHEGFAPSPIVTPGYGVYQHRPSQRHQVSTPVGSFFEGDPASDPLSYGSSDPQTSGGGAYPTPPTIKASSPASAPEDKVCAMEGCEKQCSLWDSQSVICTFCGPYSLFMYCGKEHLRGDIRDHWQYCRQKPMDHYCVENSVPPKVLIGPPAIPCKNGWDSPERHRQAMWFSTAHREGDYFLFASWDYYPSNMAPDVWGGRCSSRVVQIVQFDDPIEKDRFRRILAVCLLESVEVQQLVAYMFRLLRDKLQSTNQWSAQLDLQLRYQFQLELGVSLEPSLIGMRHACETEWNGRSPRHCRDPICIAERLHFSAGLTWAHWLERFVFNEECSHWILRASRSTHPTIKNVYARTRGERFDVVEEERRLFRRGEGWDGAGTGPMEMEGPELC